ncbi:MAG: hypothetical protein LBV22_00650 [Mycoplasmataceae bacterium]|nr:hypothetical protein [Mycoplasmataceae bacterium]
MNNYVTTKYIYIQYDLNTKSFAKWLKKNNIRIGFTSKNFYDGYKTKFKENDSLRQIYNDLQNMAWGIMTVHASYKSATMYSGLMAWYSGFGINQHKYVISEDDWLCESKSSNHAEAGKKICKLEEVVIKDGKFCFPSLVHNNKVTKLVGYNYRRKTIDDKIAQLIMISVSRPATIIIRKHKGNYVVIIEKNIYKENKMIDLMKKLKEKYKLYRYSWDMSLLNVTETNLCFDMLQSVLTE